MVARSLGIALVALAACADPKPERQRLADSDSVAPAPTSASPSAQPAPSATVSATASATASAAPDVSYPDDTIPAPATSSSMRVDQALLQDVLMDYARQAGSLRSRPSQDGMLLRGLKPESALSKIGLKNGDLLKDINGFKMSDPDEAVDAYAKLRKTKRFDIHVVRDGKAMTIVLELK